MKMLFLLCFCGFIFFPINVIHGSDSQSSCSSEEFSIQTKQRLHEISLSGERICGALKLTPGGYLGEGGFGFVYKGKRLFDSKPVAIKFIHESNKPSAEREYRIYSYLNAIDNPQIERFGIPVIYWYGHWNDFIVMALTLLQESLFDKAFYNEFTDPLDILIVFHQFVRQSKYLHSHGCKHNDIKPENILFRSYQTFLIDYNLASEMNDDTNICTSEYKPRRSYKNITRLPIDDFESFFFSMCYVNKLEFKWFFNDAYDQMDEEELDRRMSEDKNDIKDMLAKVDDIEPESLKNVFKAFYNEIFGNQIKEFPDYDGLFNIITKEIKKLVTANQPVLLTWLSRQEIKDSRKHMKDNPVPNIFKDIADPSQINFKNFTYPEVDFEHFTKTMPCISSSSSSSSSLNIII